MISVLNFIINEHVVNENLSYSMQYLWNELEILIIVLLLTDKKTLIFYRNA